MTPFQIILVAVLSLVALATVALAMRGSIGRLAGVGWLAVTGAGIVFAIRPNWTTDIAHLLGISRGTDLLLYLLVLAGLQGFLLIYLKLRRVRRELTLLVRELAIREAERRGDGGAGDTERR
jgi:hypothetical protein